ncbi:MAG: TraB/GumN family protein [Alphaproteobacteria bacterium]|nr:TraB/GumN family protein [Rhodospirillaceae bacterium]MBT6204744.1 TraB/GumN family protein [Rhodospirillaceae bacterium]MBT6511314.1 TraB/GumN family protein [Rhodospirillaceae bacterium]MBT7614852.1 TraB/GumN family protein [Rhodospirillaceae bacterium]MDG2480763.1 TraB/GumN family protein [Alphaproteobacteria bacterium]
MLRSLLPNRLHLAAFLAVLVVGTAISAQAETVDTALLWHLDPSGATEPSYLLGTMHVSDPRVLDVPQPVLDALDQSHTAVFELITDGKVTASLASAMMISDGRTLEDIVGVELFSRVKNTAQPYGFIPSVLKMFKPWAVFTILSSPVDEVFRQARGQPSLDQWLQDRALSSGKTLLALETFEEQLAVFEGISEADQISILREVVDYKAEIDQQYERMLQSYVARDLQTLYEEAKAEDIGDQGLADRFNQHVLLGRNDIMAERMLPLVTQGGFFVAVGAAHLPGDNGLLEQMRAQGFTVTPIY